MRRVKNWKGKLKGEYLLDILRNQNYCISDQRLMDGSAFTDAVRTHLVSSRSKHGGLYSCSSCFGHGAARAAILYMCKMWCLLQYCFDRCGALALSSGVTM